ncbi:unnamed protein product, partial [Mesorhabditis spiculigera]
MNKANFSSFLRSLNCDPADPLIHQLRLQVGAFDEEAQAFNSCRTDDWKGGADGEAVSSNFNKSPLTPLSRNAGRKKSHPVWEYFDDLKGVVGSTCKVACKHCEWTHDDRSPNNLKVHLKRKHTSDGLYQQLERKLAITPSQPYVKKLRAQSTAPTTQKSILPNFPLDLSLLPHMGTLLPISVGPSDQVADSEEATSANGSNVATENESPGPAEDSASPSSNDSATLPNDINIFGQLSNLLGTSPLNQNAMNIFHAMLGLNVINNPVPTFALTDGETLSRLIIVTNEMDLSMTIQRRGTESEICFDRNFTTNAPRNTQLCFTDLGQYIKLMHRHIDGEITNTEFWPKLGFPQFLQGLRARCAELFQ